MMEHVMTLGLIVAVILTAMYRIGKMKPGETRPSVVWQYVSVVLGMTGGALLSAPDYSRMSMAAGVLIFFLIGRGRWKHRAPSGTDKPDPLRTIDLNQVSGGKQ